MEHITDRVSYQTRMTEVGHLLNGDLSPHMVMAHFLAMLARSNEMAYIAGANSLEVNNIPSKGVNDIGPTQVLATNYVKDKGYRR